MGGASDKLRTAMEEMEVGEEAMDKRLVVEVEGYDAEAEREGLGGGGGVLALESTGILTKDEDPGGKTLFDALNGFNELIRLTMLWTVHHR